MMCFKDVVFCFNVFFPAFILLCCFLNVPMLLFNVMMDFLRVCLYVRVVFFVFRFVFFILASKCFILLVLQCNSIMIAAVLFSHNVTLKRARLTFSK